MAQRQLSDQNETLIEDVHFEVLRNQNVEEVCMGVAERGDKVRLGLSEIINMVYELLRVRVPDVDEFIIPCDKGLSIIIPHDAVNFMITMSLVRRPEVQTVCELGNLSCLCGASKLTLP